MERKTLEQEEEEDKVAGGADQEVAYSHNELEYIKRSIHALRNYQASRAIPRSGPAPSATSITFHVLLCRRTPSMS